MVAIAGTDPGRLIISSELVFRSAAIASAAPAIFPAAGWPP
jgi:hypothetical protein